MFRAQGEIAPLRRRTSWLYREDAGAIRFGTNAIAPDGALSRASAAGRNACVSARLSCHSTGVHRHAALNIGNCPMSRAAEAVQCDGSGASTYAQFAWNVAHCRDSATRQTLHPQATDSQRLLCNVRPVHHRGDGEAELVGRNRHRRLAMRGREVHRGDFRLFRMRLPHAQNLSHRLPAPTPCTHRRARSASPAAVRGDGGSRRFRTTRALGRACCWIPGKIGRAHV